MIIANTAKFVSFAVKGCMRSASSEKRALTKRARSKGISIVKINDLAISQKLTEAPGNNIGTAKGIKKIVISKSSNMSPMAPPTLPWATFTMVGIKGAPPPTESNNIPIRTPSETGSKPTMAKAKSGTTTKLAITERITIFIFLNGSMICAIVKPKPKVTILPATKISMDRLKTISNISFMAIYTPTQKVDGYPISVARSI